MGTAMALGIGFLTATPAAAAYDATITFPGGDTEFYSPFDGPATIRFDFSPGDPSRLFRARLRPVGGTAVKTQYFAINPASQASPQIRQFSWTALVTVADKPYEVLVNPDGQANLAVASFILRPRLVRITSATPNPFFPWIDDGYKDTTNVAFNLAADAAAEARVFRPNSAGKCCSTLVRSESLGNLSAGSNNWIWDGRNGSGNNLGQGNYFVRIWADDGIVSPALSGAKKVAIARTYRTTATKSKAGTGYHHTTESALVRGGDCALHQQGGVLQIDCHGSRMSVFYRWALGSAQRIEKQSFVIDDPYQRCPPSRRSAGHTTHESYLTVVDNVSGITSCHVVTAKITYSYLKAS